jgi:von Willebrand factor type D domain
MPGTKSYVAGDVGFCGKLIKAVRTRTIFEAADLCPKKGQLVTIYSKYTDKKGGGAQKCTKASCQKCSGAHCGGDPHFMTYDGTAYTYHGQCDLLMARSSDLDGTGISLDIHARTTIESDWSYVSNAAIRIGDDVLEIISNSNTTHYFNSAPNLEFPIAMANKFIVTKHRVEAFPGEFRTDYMIDLMVRNDDARDRGDVIRITSFKKMLSISIDAILDDSYGMLGVSGKEGMLKRDLGTEIDDSTLMGLEWQVRDTEPMLFYDTQRAPQYPEQCWLPEVNSRRRLQKQSSAAIRQAKEVCADVDNIMQQFCIHDVILTGDVQVAHMYNR